MKNNYSDIINAAGEPLWFDENGVPRYTEFHPTRCVKKNAEEIFLVEVRCQICEKPFLVAVSWKNEPRYIGPHEIPPAKPLSHVGGVGINYGDPPNIGCCQSGACTSSEFHKIIQAWIVSLQPAWHWIQLDQETIAKISAKSEVEIMR